MIWAIDQDDDAETLLNVVSPANLCAGGSGDVVKHRCSPIQDVRTELHFKTFASDQKHSSDSVEP